MKLHLVFLRFQRKVKDDKSRIIRKDISVGVRPSITLVDTKISDKEKEQVERLRKLTERIERQEEELK